MFENKPGTKCDREIIIASVSNVSYLSQVITQLQFRMLQDTGQPIATRGIGS
jgi:hypothetical protein